MDRRRRNLVVNREPSFFTSWTGERLEVLVCGMLSRVMSVASRSGAAFPFAEVSLEHQASLSVSSQSVPPSVRSSTTGVFSWTMRSSLGANVCFTRAKCFLSRTKRNSDARGHLSVPVENRLQYIAGDPILTEEQGGDHLLERRVVKTLAARWNYQTALGTSLRFVMQHAFPLVEDVEIDGALVAYSNDCFVQGLQHHHVSQLLAAVMDRCLSFDRLGQGFIDV